DELTNFTLGLTNPSTQADLLKIENWKEKILLYKDAVADPGNGIQAVSTTWAKKHILGFSDEEIKLDLQQQRIERAVGEELKKTAEVIIHTGLFDNIDKLYGKKETEEAKPAEGGGETTGGAEPPSDFGGGDLGAPSPPETGGGEPPAEGGGETLPEETFNKENLNILLENSGMLGEDEIIDLSKVKKS
ncbi:MAG: portal protein, partial [bacterium]